MARTHQEAGLAILVANLVGVASLAVRWIKSRRPGGKPGGDVTVLR